MSSGAFGRGEDAENLRRGHPCQLFLLLHYHPFLFPLLPLFFSPFLPSGGAEGRERVVRVGLPLYKPLSNPVPQRVQPPKHRFPSLIVVLRVLLVPSTHSHTSRLRRRRRRRRRAPFLRTRAPTLAQHTRPIRKRERALFALMLLLLLLGPRLLLVAQCACGRGAGQGGSVEGVLRRGAGQEDFFCVEVGGYAVG